MSVRKIHDSSIWLTDAEVWCRDVGASWVRDVATFVAMGKRWSSPAMFCVLNMDEHGVFLQLFFILLARFGDFRRNLFFAFIGSIWDSQFTKRINVTKYKWGYNEIHLKTQDIFGSSKTGNARTMITVATMACRKTGKPRGCFFGSAQNPPEMSWNGGCRLTLKSQPKLPN